jgi:hypothetical protein
MLAGDALNLYKESGRRMAPAWAYLNQLAHSNVEDLVRLARRCHDDRSSVWDETVSYLAAELLGFDGRPEAIVNIQREVLIPIELDVLAGRKDSLGAPPEFVSVVLRALQQHRTRPG